MGNYATFWTGLSLALLLVIILFMSVANMTAFDIDFYYGAGQKALGSALVWLTVILALVAMVVVDMTHIALHRVMFPSATYIIQEQERGLAPLYHAEGGAPSSPSSPVRNSESEAFLSSEGALGSTAPA